MRNYASPHVTGYGFSNTLKPNSAPRRGFGSYWISSDTLASGRTGIMRLQAPIGAVGGFVNFAHYGSGYADISKAGIATVSAVSDNSATKPYQLLSFSGAPSGVIQPAIPGLYPPGYRVSPKFLRSDYFGLPGIPRTDFPGRGMLFDVAFQVGARSITAGEYSPTDSGNTPWVLGWTNSASDLISVPTPQTMYPYMATFCWVEWVYSGSRSPVLAIYGDSIFDGISASNILDGYMQNSAYSAGIELYSNSCGGRTSFDTWDSMRGELPGLSPKIDAVAICAWTPNDEVQGYSYTTVFARFLKEKSWIESLGIRCIVVGPMPFSGSSTPGLIRDLLVSNGVEFFNAGNLVATNSTFLTWEGSLTNDFIHPNDAGYSVLTEQFRPYSTEIVTPNIPALYSTFGDLPLSGNTLGKIRHVKRISGPNVSSTGYYKCQWNGSRWEVMIGESVFAMNDEVVFSSPSTAETTVCSADIPGNMFGETECWEMSVNETQLGNTVDPALSHRLCINSVVIWSNTTGAPSLPFTIDPIPRKIRRYGDLYRFYTIGVSDTVAQNEFSTGLGAATQKTFSYKIQASAIGGIYRVRRFYLKRIS